jgi:pantetheine-phosphate adenylyltransferase
MKTAIFPGTFDPFTLGHASIVERGLMLFDEIIIAIGYNADKKTLFSSKERLLQISTCYQNEPRVSVFQYNGLTADFAKERNASFILRGVRTISDFEYERMLSDLNQQISGIETIFLFTNPTLASIQSNVVRDLLRYNKDVSAYVPEPICKLFNK